MPDRTPDRERFSLDLPFWLNGTLDKNDALWMEAYLQAHPECQAEYRFVHDLRELDRSDHSPIPEEERLAQFMAKFHRIRPRRHWTSRLADWLRAPTQIPAYALAGLVALLLGEATLLGMRPSEQEASYRGVNISADCASSTFKVTFNPDARQADVLTLLRQQGLIIVHGPSETGEIWLMMPAGQLPEVTRAQLRNHPAVQDIQDASAPPGCKQGR